MCESVYADLVEVVVFLRFEQVEGLPLLFTGSSQQVVEHMVVPTNKHTHTKSEGVIPQNKHDINMQIP